MFRNLFLALFLIFFFPLNAYSYIDPGTGSYIIQMVIAGILAGAYGIKLTWRYIIEFFRNLFNRKSKTD